MSLTGRRCSPESSCPQSSPPYTHFHYSTESHCFMGCYLSTADIPSNLDHLVPRNTQIRPYAITHASPVSTPITPPPSVSDLSTTASLIRHCTQTQSSAQSADKSKDLEPRDRIASAPHQAPSRKRSLYQDPNRTRTQSADLFGRRRRSLAGPNHSIPSESDAWLG